MRKGFTILELLAASLLLSMLVTALTMIFNQSSIAWRTGVAGVVDLGKTRVALGSYHDIEDDALPGLGQTGVSVGGRAIQYRTVSIFREWGNGTIDPSKVSKYHGLFDQIKWNAGAGNTMLAITDGDARNGNGNNMTLDHGSSQGGDAYVVGVRSAGPDKRSGTADDISTFPEEEN